MKLRNKRTGEIIDIYKGEITLQCNQGRKTIQFKSIEELEKWEDYEEPKKHYSITQFGDVEDEVDLYMSETIDEMKEIGNYFESKEEAELAVRKLKAWKRLKDYNVMFNLDFVKNKIDFTYSINNLLLDVLDGEEQIFNNMKIVFGGEDA